MTSYQPGTYRKGDQVRVCDTAADAVQATFNGFKRDADEAPEPQVDDTTSPAVDDVMSVDLDETVIPDDELPADEAHGPEPTDKPFGY